jgi:hypothetical protein
MHPGGACLLRALQIAPLVLSIAAQQALCASPPAGKVVWWGNEFSLRPLHSENTNGVIESDNEILTNVIAIAARHSTGLALTTDGAVIAFGSDSYGSKNVPAGLSNVVSIALEGNSCWAIRRDSTVARWGDDEDDANIVAGLSNITAVAWAGDRTYVALKNDGTLITFWFDIAKIVSSVDIRTGRLVTNPAVGLATDLPLVRTVQVGGQPLRNIVSIASIGNSVLLLKNDSTVTRLEFGPIRTFDPVSGRSMRPTQDVLSDVVTLAARTLTNVVALAGGARSALALKSNGTVVGLGDSYYGVTNVPAGLSNVIAIANDERGLALKSDGTVVQWGGALTDMAAVPAGLSNVVAIAAGGSFALALTTGNVPASVYIQPHGRLEEMEREADFIFKGQVISSTATNGASFPDWAKPHATQLRLISSLKGKVATNQPVFWHYTGLPQAWGGGAPPSSHQLEAGQSYLIFAATLDKPAYTYSPPPDATNRSNEFRQLYRDGVTRTLDTRPVASTNVKSAHWYELNLLLQDNKPTNQLYGIERLDSMSLGGRRDDEWSRSGDFKRKDVLTAILPLLTNRNDQVACRALGCFATETNASARLAPFLDDLTHVANQSLSPTSRLAAISALSGISGDAVSISLAQLLKNPDENIRVGAVRLLPRFPTGFAEQALRECAGDGSANVRSVVADVIGDSRYVGLLPTLAKLFADPIGRDTLIKPLTIEDLRAGRRWSNIGDVHTSAGFALVKFEPDQVSAILRTNLADPGFHINFVSKLAETNPAPWLVELVRILEERIKYVDELSRLPPLDERRFADPGGDRILIGTYSKCWEDIRQYLLKLPTEKLSAPENVRLVDLLDKTVRPIPGCPTCANESTSLYDLYRSKGLSKRASETRRRYGASQGWWFDEYDRTH